MRSRASSSDQSEITSKTSDVELFEIPKPVDVTGVAFITSRCSITQDSPGQVDFVWNATDYSAWSTCHHRGSIKLTNTFLYVKPNLPLPIIGLSIHLATSLEGKLQIRLSPNWILSLNTLSRSCTFILPSLYQSNWYHWTGEMNRLLTPSQEPTRRCRK